MKLTKFIAFAFAASAVAFAACDPVESNDPKPTPTGDIVLSADKTTVLIGETVTFTVTDSMGQDVTSQALIYDKNLDEVGSTVTFTKSGSYSYFATIGLSTSNYVEIVVAASIPEVPEDPQPENFKFNHRALVIDQTGVNCGYCPQATEQLKTLENTEWHQYYNEVTCHAGSYASGDPGNSAAANALNKFQGSMISGYPCILVNFYGKPADYGYTSIISVLKNYVQKDGVDVGIASAVTGDSQNVYCAAQIKSAVAKEYKITAWLLESNIYSPNQAGASKDYHRIYNHALRNMSHSYSNTNVQGDAYTFEANEVKEIVFELPILLTKWNYENMEVLVIVSAKDSNGRWEVANSLTCKINETKQFEYLQ